MKFILGLKKEMTQIFTDNGDVIPVTVVITRPCRVVKVKTKLGADGYSAVVLGMGGKKKLSRRHLGQIKDLGNLAYIKEFHLDEDMELTVGDTVSVGTFVVGDKVKVVGISKGKGFQGVVKRHGFKGHRATHGTKDQERAAGSVGPTEPARVFPGMRMPGHMGSDQVTVKNLEVVKVDEARNELYIKGAVPGAKQSLLILSAAGELKVNLPTVENISSPDKDISDNVNNQKDIQADDKKAVRNSVAAEEKPSLDESAASAEQK